MMFKTIKNLATIFIIIVLLGFFLMVVSYSLPSGNAHEHIIDDAPIFSDLTQFLIPDDYTTRLDIYTDSIILSEILYYNESASLIDNAMSVYGIPGGKDFQKFVDGDDSVIREYPRYWHGNLVVYKPLYSFFNLNTIKIFELFFEAVMVIGILKLMLDNNLKRYILPFLLSLYFIHPLVIGLSLQFAPPFNIMLISVFIMLKFKDKLFIDNRLLYYFLIIGMSTSFFDFLSYPLISLGIPLIFYIILESENYPLKDILIKILLFAGIWAVGYIGMWFSKWFISSIILNENVILNGLSSVMSRSSSMEFTRFDAILANVSIYNGFYILILVVIAIYYIRRLIKAHVTFTENNLRQLIPFILISLTPFAWYFVASNHSYIHFWFTYRLLFIFFFGIMCALEYIIGKNEVMALP